MQPASTVVHYRTVDVKGLGICHREARPKNATIVLLHDVPRSSFQYCDLIPALACRYHVIAQDDPDFGGSSDPDHTTASCAFARLNDVTGALLAQFGVGHLANRDFLGRTRPAR